LKNDRFLIGILVGVFLIILLSLGAYMIRQNSNMVLPEDQPEGVVNNYILALYDKDYEKAYAYLATGDFKPTLEAFRQAFISGSLNLGYVSMKIGETVVSDQQATVYLTFIHGSNGPFSEPYREQQIALLVLENGAWKISSLPYPLWNWDWYQEVPK
jgi:hypothetical protein